MSMQTEITMDIIKSICDVVPYFNVDIKEQIKLRDKIEEKLNNYEIATKCTALVKSDILEHAFTFLACKKLEGMKKGTIYNYTLLLKRLDSHLNKPISTITTIDLRMFLATAFKDNQPNSLNTKISNLKAFFAWMQDEGYILQNPARNLQQIKEPYRRRGHVKEIDLERMREHCKTIRDKALFEVLISTGCRVSEIVDARISCVDWNENSMTVVGKGDKERKVFFSTRARLFLMNYIKKREENGILSDSLFVTEKSPHEALGKRSIERDIERIAKAAGIEYNVFPHLLRHSFATIAVNQDVPVHALQRMLGHSEIGVTEKYYDLDEASIKNEYRKIAL